MPLAFPLISSITSFNPSIPAFTAFIIACTSSSVAGLEKASACSLIYFLYASTFASTAPLTPSRALSISAVKLLVCWLFPASASIPIFANSVILALTVFIIACTSCAVAGLEKASACSLIYFLYASTFASTAPLTPGIAFSCADVKLFVLSLFPLSASVPICSNKSVILFLFGSYGNGSILSFSPSPSLSKSK